MLEQKFLFIFAEKAYILINYGLRNLKIHFKHGI
jgi:hypothetical protein